MLSRATARSCATARTARSSANSGRGVPPRSRSPRPAFRLRPSRLGADRRRQHRRVQGRPCGATDPSPGLLPFRGALPEPLVAGAGLSMVKPADRPSFPAGTECSERIMHGGEDAVSFEATVRRAFSRLTCEDLPRAAAARGWPVSSREDFERLLLESPARRPRGGATGTVPVRSRPGGELGERMLAGNLCCHRMSHRNQTVKPCSKERQRDALAGLLAAVAQLRRESP